MYSENKQTKKQQQNNKNNNKKIWQWQTSGRKYCCPHQFGL